MRVTEIKAKSLLRKHKKIDSWFISSYGMNLYRGCIHDCSYCDGRAEGYYVQEDFGEHVMVKVNAPEILDRELNPTRKRKPFEPGFVLLGGGVGDSYQPVDLQYQLSRKALEIIRTHGRPVHVLTKSTGVLRDVEILKEINRQNQALVSFSFSTLDDTLANILEPGVPPPSERLRAISQLRDAGLSCGMFLMPVIPFISDHPNHIALALKQGKQAGAQFAIFGGLTLKQGRQQDHFYRLLQQHFPEKITFFNHVYKGDRWGSPSQEYVQTLNEVFFLCAQNIRIPVRIPPHIYRGILDETNLAIVTLEHLDYLLRMKGQTTPYGYAARSISKLKQPISDLKFSLKSIQGVGPTTARILGELLKSGNCSYLERLLRFEKVQNT